MVSLFRRMTNFAGLLLLGNFKCKMFLCLFRSRVHEKEIHLPTGNIYNWNMLIFGQIFRLVQLSWQSNNCQLERSKDIQIVNSFLSLLSISTRYWSTTSESSIWIVLYEEWFISNNTAQNTIYLKQIWRTQWVNYFSYMTRSFYIFL